MKSRFLLLLAALAAVIGLGLVVVPAPAGAVTRHWSYSASAGATYVQLADGTVNSDLTAESSVTGGPKSTSATNSTAAASAPLVTVGAVQTKVTATRGTSSTTLKSWARTAGVNLLGGLITVDAVTTNVTTKGTDAGAISYSGNSQLAGIHIAGIHLPLSIPKNYSVRIPGVATVALNYTMHSNHAGQVGTFHWALGVTLLKPRGTLPAGATVLLNPVTQFLVDVPPSPGAHLGGMAFGTRVKAAVGDTISVDSGPTAFIGTPYGSSKGVTKSNTTAGVNVPALLTTGAVSSTTWSVKDALGNAEVRNTNELAGLNLLGGLIRADAVKVLAHGKKQGSTWTSNMKLTFVNLVVAGQKIPLDVSPNTVINVAGLGSVAINRQVQNRSKRTNEIDAVRITLSTARAGFKAGAVIEIGVAATQIS